MLKKISNFYRSRFWSAERYGRHLGVRIGKGCMISTKKFSSEPYLITIGDHCRIAPEVMFFTHGGLWSQRKKYPNLDYFGKIRVGNYTYIGEGAKIMPGVTIGDDFIIGAGSIVTKSVESGKIAAGNPARIVGETKDFVTRISSQNVNSKKMNYNQKRIFLESLNDDQFVRK